MISSPKNTILGSFWGIFTPQTLKQDILKIILPEAVARRCSVKKMFLEISQNSQENTCARVSILLNLLASGLQLY